MDPYSVLLARIEDRQRDLRFAKRGLSSDAIGEVGASVRVLFEGELDNRVDELGDLAKSVDQAKRDNNGVGRLWDDLRTLDEGCRKTVREYFAVLGGALIRNARLDGDVCQIADALLGSLADSVDIPWRRLTILAEDEFIASMSDIVRLRYPNLDIWRLPIAAHEFGHFVAGRHKDRLQGSRPFKRLLQREKERVRDKDLDQVTENRLVERVTNHIHEYFADLFAICAIGPAYAFTCVLSRFDPRTAHESGETHPRAMARVHLMIKQLESLDGVNYRGVADGLWRIWSETVAAATGDDDLGPGAEERLGDLRDEMEDRVLRRLPRGIRWDGWPEAVRLAGEFEIAGKVRRGEKTTLRDVINGAWLWRFRHWDERRAEPAAVGRDALGLCRELLAAPAGAAR